MKTTSTSLILFLALAITFVFAQRVAGQEGSPIRVPAAQSPETGPINRLTRDSAPLPSRRYKLSVDVSEPTFAFPVLDLGQIEKKAPNQIGVNRSVDISAKSWAKSFKNDDGSEIQIITIKSPGAVGIRVHFDAFDLPKGDEVYVYGTSADDEVMGPYRGKGQWGNKEFWSGTVTGDTVVIERYSKTGNGDFRVREISHIYQSLTYGLLLPEVLPCQQDASCFTNPEKNSVARITFVEGSSSFVCTGTLLNDRNATQTPFFLTARHCVSTQTGAQTVESYWFYQSSSCNSGILRTGIVHQSSGANLLVTHQPSDSTLLRMVDAAPAGAVFSGWDAGAKPVSTTVYGLHHPGTNTPPGTDSLLRRSDGQISSITGSCSPSGLTNGYKVDWSSGITEPGSSGSGLRYSTGAANYIIGVDSCGPTEVNCNFNGLSYALYGKFSDFYPLIQSIIDPPQANISITVQTAPAGRSFTVDGTTYTSAQTFSWTPASSHTISTTSPQNGTTGTRYLWSSWSDAGAISHSVAPGSSTTLTANFVTQYFLTMSAGAGGTVTPASGFFNSGQSIQISASANSGFTFSGWTGSGSGSFSGATNPVNVTMNGPINETASFSASSSCSPGNKLQDPGFEASSGTGPITNPFWSSTSTNFGTSLCSAALCGSVPSAAPRTGTFWTWFGGVNGPETGRISQTRTIPSGGSATLHYYLRIGAVTAPFTDVLNVRVDGAIVQTVNEPNAGESGYSLRSVNLNAFANGGQHTIMFEYISPSGGGVANFSVDDVTLDMVCGTFRSSNIGVFRPSNGIVYLKNSNSGGVADVSFVYGVAGDKPIAGDWDNNGTDTLGIYRNGTFYLRNSNSTGAANIVFAFGAPGDLPIAGDWNGDHIDTVGVYRPSTGVFYLRNSNTAGPAEVSFVLGNPGDVPIAGDWNGDGVTTTGVFRPSNGIIYLKNSNTSGVADIYLVYGNAGDLPLAGDWNGDVISSVGIYRNGVFYLRNSNTQGFADLVFAMGNNLDVPIAGDWDGLP